MSQQINLFNPIFLKQKKIFASVPMVRALGLLLVGVALLVVYGSQNVATLERRAAEGATRLSQQQARMATVNTEYAPRQPSKELGVELAVAEAHLRALRDVSAVLARGDIGNTAGYSAYFKALARQNVDGMWLTGVSIVGAGNEIGVQGRALDAKLVPQFITRLANEPALRGKSFAALSIERPPPTPAVPPAPGSPAATALAASSSGATAGRAAPAPALAGPTPSPFVDFSLQSLAQAPAGAQMKAPWLTWSAKVDALTLRERGILFGATAVAIVLICNTFLLEPLFARRTLLNEQIKQQNNNLIGLNDEISAKVVAFAIDPDAAARKRLAEVKTEVALLEDRMRTMQQGLVAPERIVPMLDVILKSNGRLRVMSLKTLPVSGLSDPAPGESKPAEAKPGEPAAAANATAAAGAPGGANNNSAVVAVVTPAQLLYRHGVEITVEGAYLDMVDYMSALEAMPTQLFWGKAALDVQQYPRARLTLTLYTLSLDQKWMKL